LHQALYGHSAPDTPVEFVNLRTVHTYALPAPRLERVAARAGAERCRRKAYFPALGGFVETPVYDRASLAPQHSLAGPPSSSRRIRRWSFIPGRRRGSRPEEASSWR
jgi:N-methylhydantoinase A